MKTLKIKIEDFGHKGTEAYITRTLGVKTAHRIESRLGSFLSMEKYYDKIEIVFPIKDISATSKTFFLGLLGDRMVDLKPESFKKKYSVKNLKEYLEKNFYEAIEASQIANLSMKEILGN